MIDTLLAQHTDILIPYSSDIQTFRLSKAKKLKVDTILITFIYHLSGRAMFLWCNHICDMCTLCVQKNNLASPSCLVIFQFTVVTPCEENGSISMDEEKTPTAFDGTERPSIASTVVDQGCGFSSLRCRSGRKSTFFPDTSQDSGLGEKLPDSR